MIYNMKEILEEFLRYSIIYKIKIEFFVKYYDTCLNTLIKMMEIMDYYYI
jgi:hypothetical protein